MNNNVLTGISKTSSCRPLIWLAGAFAIYQTLEKSHSFYLSPAPSCLAATNDGSQLAVADNKRIIVLHGQKYEILLNACVKSLFYSSKGSYLVAVEDDGISVYSRIQKLIVTIPISKVMHVDFDLEEEYMITVTSDTVQKWDIRTLNSDDALKKYQLSKTLRIDSVILNAKFTKAVWSGSGMRSIHAITDTGMLLVIKDNLWVDRWVDVKMNIVNCILCWRDIVIIAGSYTRIFELDTLTYKASFKRHEASANKARPDVISLHLVEENIIALIYSNHNIDFWNIKDLSNILFIKRKAAHSGPILSVSKTSTDSMVTFSKDGSICSWGIERKDHQTVIELRKRLVINSHPSDAWVIASAVSDIHRLVAFGDHQGFIKLYSMNDLVEVGHFISQNLEIKIINFADWQEKCILASSYANQTIKIFEFDGGLKLLQTIDNVRIDIIALCFCQNSQKLVTASRDALVFRVCNDKKIFEEYFSMKSADPICDICYDSGRDQLLCATENRKILFLSLNDGKILLSLNWDYVGNTLNFSKLKFDCATSFAAVACSDNTILLLDLKTGKNVNKYAGHCQKILGLEFSQEENMLYSCDDDGLLIAWEMVEHSITRSFSEGTLNSHSVDLPTEYVPAWARKHSKSDVPILNRSIIPQGRWAQRISLEGIRLHSDSNLTSPPVASFHKIDKKRLSAEVELTCFDHITKEYESERLQFDVIQRDKWDFSKVVKLINQSERSLSDISTEDKLIPNTILNSLDLAGASSAMSGAKSGSVEISGHIRSKSDFSDVKDSESILEEGVKAVGIVLKKGQIYEAIDSPAFNIGEVEDDDENQCNSNVTVQPTEGPIQIEDERPNESKRERHATLGFVEAMVQQLDILRSSDAQNMDKISDLENELSKIGNLVNDALSRR